MFTLLSGPFHPHLESKLVETVQQMKAVDPRTPFAIVVPSESLRRRLQWLLCVEYECALFNVHFLTFHQFALRLDAERQAVSRSGSSDSSLELVGNLFYEYALSIILQQDRSSSNPLALRAESSGICPALWRTIQDLQEAQVEPSVILRGLQEGLFDEMAIERLQGVVGLQAVLKSWSGQLGVGLPDDLSHAVIPWVPQSPYIAKFSAVIYYGFYDITQVQLSLLEEVARATAVTVFFPLLKGEASRFAQRFFDRHLLKAGVSHQSIPDGVGSSPQEQVRSLSPTIRVVNAVGPEGELNFMCKAIVQSVESIGGPWHEIGVVARNLDPYLPYLQRICDKHRIPFWTTATKPLLEEPMAKVWWILAGLREEQFPWRKVLDVVISPWYRGVANIERNVFQEYSHLWAKAVHHFRLVGGDNDWERLAHVARDPEAIQEWQESSGVPLAQASESLGMFADVVVALLADCRALPAMGSMGECTKAFERLAKRHLWFPTDRPSSAGNETDDERNECLMDGFEQVISSLRPLDRLDRQVTWEQWLSVFRAALERADLPFLGQAQMGVQVLDVMAARGRSFKALFMLGMNDHVFPRVVREDAFLRDRDRKVLAESLGYKIDEKLTGFDEETLLFALLQHSARDHLYLLYQRADQNGRPLIPSSLLRNYLDGSESHCSDGELTFPVGLIERSRYSYFSSEGETLQETRLCSILEGRPLPSITPKEFPWWNVFPEGLVAIRHLERSGKAGPFDGFTKPQNIHWQDLVSRGLSPTALGTYAQCPMRYWMTHVLKVGGVQDPMSKELPSRVWGELVHIVLCEVYQAISKHGWPQQALNRLSLAEIVNSQVDQVFQDYARKLGTGYRLIWDWMKVRLVRMMLSMIEIDQRDYAEQGLVPYGYELEAAGEFAGEVHAQPELLKIRGRFDRVDKAMGHSRFRIIDYKVSLRRSFQADELDLVNKALQGRQLQPPLYSFMNTGKLERDMAGVEVPTSPIQSVDFRYLRPMQEEPVHSASFSGAIWDTATGEQLRRTIQGWIQGIRDGQFFILPGRYCRNCQFTSACRFQHHPSWLRAYGLPLARTFRQVRKQKASNG